MPPDRDPHVPIRTVKPGREDYHDPTAGIGGAPPARSALTLRLVLAAFGLLACAGGAAGIAIIGGSAVFVGVLAALTVAALIDIVVIRRRKRRGEPG